MSIINCGEWYWCPYIANIIKKTTVSDLRISNSILHSADFMTANWTWSGGPGPIKVLLDFKCMHWQEFLIRNWFNVDFFYLEKNKQKYSNEKNIRVFEFWKMEDKSGIFTVSGKNSLHRSTDTVKISPLIHNCFLKFKHFDTVLIWIILFTFR